MKTSTIIVLGIITAVICGCNRKVDRSETRTLITVGEINTVIRNHLPDEQANLVSHDLGNTKHSLRLTPEEYQHLQFALVDELKEYFRNKHQYDTFTSSAKVHDSDCMTFSISLGRDGGCDYIVNSIRAEGITGNANVIIEIYILYYNG